MSGHPKPWYEYIFDVLCCSTTAGPDEEDNVPAVVAKKVSFHRNVKAYSPVHTKHTNEGVWTYNNIFSTNTHSHSADTPSHIIKTAYITDTMGNARTYRRCSTNTHK